VTQPPTPEGVGAAPAGAAPNEDAGEPRAGAAPAHGAASSATAVRDAGELPAGAGSISRTVRLLAVSLGCLAFIAPLARALVLVDDDVPLLLVYGGLVGLSLALYVYALLRTPRSAWARHGLLAVQCLVVAETVAIGPAEVDFMNSLFVPLAAEAAMVFTGRVAWIWVAIVAALTAAPLTGLDDAVEGFARALVSLAAEAVLAAYIVVARDLEAARRRSQAMLDDLRAAHAQLEAYAARAGEFAAVGERDRVARDLNESVAARIGNVLAAAEAARRVLGAGPAGGPTAPDGEASGPDTADEPAALLAAIQADTQQALADMRGLITELRPAAG
jgi:signal transduction histidine kinase